MNPRRSIILIYFREPQYLRDIVPALEAEFPLAEETEIIVVDNNSGDGVANEVAVAHPRLTLISSPENLFYGKGANLGMQRAHGDWLMILNVDIEWERGSLRAFAAAAETDERISVAGPLVRYADGRVQVTAHHQFPTAWTVFVDYCLPLQQLFMRSTTHPHQLSPAQHAHTQQVAHLTGVCLYVRRAAYERVGGFDPAYIMYLEETDWERRLHQAGYGAWLLTAGSIIHFGSAKKTFAQASPRYLQGLALYATRWWQGPWKLTRLMCVWWLAWFMSILVLVVAYIPSLLHTRIRRRIQHYLLSYFRLAGSLVRFTPPRA